METVYILEKHSTNYDIVLSCDGDFGYVSKRTKKTKKVSKTDMISIQDITKKRDYYLKEGYKIVEDNSLVV